MSGRVGEWVQGILIQGCNIHVINHSQLLKDYHDIIMMPAFSLINIRSALVRNSGRKKNSGMSSFTSVVDSEEDSHHVVPMLRKVRSAMSKLSPKEKAERREEWRDEGREGQEGRKEGGTGGEKGRD